MKAVSTGASTVYSGFIGKNAQKPENNGNSGELARFVNAAGGKAVLRTVEKLYTPKEAAAALRECGFAVCAGTLRLRAKLPAVHPLYIRRVRGSLGRYLFPESELVRLVTVEDDA